MNMQQLEENNKTQAKVQKIEAERFLAALHLLTIQYDIEIFAPEGFMLIEPEDTTPGEYLSRWAGRVHYRGRSCGYVAMEWHPDLIENEEEGDEYFVEREVEK